LPAKWPRRRLGDLSGGRKMDEAVRVIDRRAGKAPARSASRQRAGSQIL
jgi:hypothetical protein